MRDRCTLVPGKLSPELLKQAVFSRTGAKREEILVPPAIGEDATVIDMGQELLVATTDPITGANDKAGWFAVKIAVNDIGASGCEPVCVLVTLLLPEGYTCEQLEEIMSDIDLACREENVALAGGHTEVTPGLPQPIISVTAIGKSRQRRVLSSSSARPGDDIVVTKWAGMEGTAILARDFEDNVKSVLTPDELRQAKDLIRDLSVVRDGAIALDNNATACHDATEGGVLGAIYEICQASQVGALVLADNIPILPVTKKIAEVAGVDPLKLISSGCLVVTVPDGTHLCNVYRQHGINAAVVGKIISGQSHILRSGKTYPLDPPSTDELWKARAYFERQGHGGAGEDGR